MVYTIEAACNCNKGKVRKTNQDNFYFGGKYLEVENNGLRNSAYLEMPSQTRLCLAVFDGMGGENFGEIAAFSAARQMKKTEQDTSDFLISEKEYLKRLVFEMNDAVVTTKRRLMTSHMGTTLVALYFSSRYVYACNVGDSRAYRLRDNVFMQISNDHVEHTPHGRRDKAPLTQYLGMDPNEITIDPYIAKGELRNGDRYLLCSDGLYDVISNCEIVDILTKNKDVEMAAQALVDAALAGGGRDNVTVIVCNVTT